MRVERDWRGIGEGTDGGARGKRGLFGNENGGVLRVRERRRGDVGKRKIRRIGGRGVRVEGVCLGGADGRVTRGWAGRS